MSLDAKVDGAVPYPPSHPLSKTTDPRTRYAYLAEVAKGLPSDRSRAEVELLLADPVPLIATQAAERLLSCGFPISRDKLPRGYGGVNRDDPAKLAAALAALRRAVDAVADDSLGEDDGRGWSQGRGASDATPARLLGLLGDERDLPRLRRLVTHRNTYVRYLATNAVLALGDRQAAVDGYRGIGRLPLRGTTYYFRQAALARHRLEGRPMLVELVAQLESPEAADRAHAILEVLRDVTGVAGSDAAAFRAWLAERGD